MCRVIDMYAILAATDRGFNARPTKAKGTCTMTLNILDIVSGQMEIPLEIRVCQPANDLRSGSDRNSAGN